MPIKILLLEVKITMPNWQLRETTKLQTMILTVHKQQTETEDALCVNVEGEDITLKGCRNPDSRYDSNYAQGHPGQNLNLTMPPKKAE